MNKYAFMVFHKEYDKFLSLLCDLGVVHVKETQSPISNPEVQELMDLRKNLNFVLRNIKAYATSHECVPEKSVSKEEGLALIRMIENFDEEKVRLNSLLSGIDKDLDYLSIWGDFSYESINQLKNAGYVVSFFSCPTAKYEPKWNKEYNAFLVNAYQSISYFITITKPDVVVEIDAERAKMPELDTVGLEAKRREVVVDIKDTEEAFHKAILENYNTLLRFDKDLQDEFNLRNALVQTEKCADDKLMLLEGWVPCDNASVMEEKLESNNYYFQQLEITDEDKVPIKLKNNAFTRLFEPITSMFSLPNYGEFDPTPFFAPFFMLFFGMCFGDGGYGLLLMVVCTLLMSKVQDDIKPYLSLFRYLGLAALIVGTCTGSFFGVALVDVPAFSAVKDYFLSSDNLMTLSIIIGLVQIVFGKVVAALKVRAQRGTKYSIAPFAWVFAIVSMLVAVGLPVLNIQLPLMLTNVLYGITAVGIVVAYLYNSPGKNVFMNIGTGLWNTYNMASGLLGDTLSYIRLFAIGLTGSILGGVFNALAISMTESMSIVPRIIVMLLILLAGHTINIGLCTISSLVHPLRLVFVEYYKNAEFEGGGKAYRPFKKA